MSEAKRLNIIKLASPDEFIQAFHNAKGIDDVEMIFCTLMSEIEENFEKQLYCAFVAGGNLESYPLTEEEKEKCEVKDCFETRQSPLIFKFQKYLDYAYRK